MWTTRSNRHFVKIPSFQAHTFLRSKFSVSASKSQQVVVTPPSIKYNRPIAGIRAGLLGFLAGLTLVGTYAYLNIFEEYQSATNTLLVSVEELKSTTHKITNQIKRIEQVERDLARIKSTSISEEQLQAHKSQLNKSLDALKLDQLKIRSSLSDLETDFNKFATEKSGARMC